MAIYGIMHTIKLKKADLGGVQIENNRTEKDQERKFAGSDIEWEHTAENIHLRKSKNWYKSAFEQMKKYNVGKIKKDSVIAIQTLYTASRDFFDKDENGNPIYNEKADKFLRDCVKFHVKKYCGGDPDLVINAVIHLDEVHEENGNFHLHITSVPITRNERGENVLSAKRVLGGKSDFVKAQDDFFHDVCEPRKMERGQSANETKRKHLNSIEYKLQQETEKLELAMQENRMLQEQIKLEQAKHMELENAYDKKLKAMQAEYKKLYEKNKMRLDQQIQTIEKTVVKWLKAEGALGTRRKPTEAEIKTIQNIARDVKSILQNEIYTPAERSEMEREAEALRQEKNACRQEKEKYEELSADIEKNMENHANTVLKQFVGRIYDKYKNPIYDSIKHNNPLWGIIEKKHLELNPPARGENDHGIFVTHTQEKHRHWERE